jgi:hypothetical protein
MTSEHIALFLAQSGLDAGALGAAERLLLPEPEVDEARTARAGVALAPPGSSDGGLLQVRSDALGAAGITAGFDEEARTLVLTAPAELAFRLAAPGQPGTPGEAQLSISGTDGGTRVQVTTELASAFGLWSAAGPLALGSVDARAIELRVVHAWPAPDLPDGIAVPGWDRWEATVAAGRVARGVEPDANQDSAIRARRWLRRLTADQRTLMERFAIVEAQRVATRLGRLQDGFGVDASLDLAWQALCWDRDDVEGIRVLLREAGAGQRLAAALRRVDEVGRSVRFSWPSEVDVHDDRLQHVSEADPGAWWGSTRRQVAWL